MTGRLPRVRGAALAAMLLALGAACSSPSGADDFASYRSAPLTAGVGLGDLRLGDTTLGAFFERFPGGVPSALIGDVIGAELAFPQVGLAFLFAMEGECHAAVAPRARRLASDLARPAAFFAEVPECRGAPLHSISVRAASTADATFFVGQSDGGVALWTPVAGLAQAEGPAEDLRGLWLADSQPQDRRYEDAAYSRGIAYAVGAAPVGDGETRLAVLRIAIFRVP